MVDSWFGETHEAVDRVEANADPMWKDVAYDTVVQLAAETEEFTSDDVRERLDKQEVTTKNMMALGPIMVAVARAGLIEQTGEFRISTRRVAHNAPKRVWASKILRG